LRRRGRASGEPAPARAESAGCVITLAMSTPFLEPSDLPASSFSRELAGAEPGGIQTDGLAAGRRSAIRRLPCPDQSKGRES